MNVFKHQTKLYWCDVHCKYSLINLYHFDRLFVLQKLQTSKFDARRKFKLAILFVRAMIRIQRLRFTPEPLSIEAARCDPYRIKILRKVSFWHQFLICRSLRVVFRWSTVALFGCTATGWRRARAKTGLRYSKIPQKRISSKFTWPISAGNV